MNHFIKAMPHITGIGAFIIVGWTLSTGLVGLIIFAGIPCAIYGVMYLTSHGL